MLTPRRMRLALTTSITTGLLLTILLAGRADAAPAYRPTAEPTRVGLKCNIYRYLIWQTRACVTVRFRKDRLGQWEVQPAAALAGYNRTGRRKMRMVVATRLEGYGTADHGFTERLVERGPWRTPADSVGRATAVFVWRWPNGRKSAARMYSNP